MNFNEIACFNYILDLPKATLAWEYLRRNTAYQRDWLISKAGAPNAVCMISNFKIVRCRRVLPCARKWGLEFFQ